MGILDMPSVTQNVPLNVSMSHIGLALWIVCEVAFAIAVIYFIAPPLQKLRNRQPNDVGPAELFKRILSTVDGIKLYNSEKFFHGFFRGAKQSDVYKENCLSLIAFSMLNKKLPELLDAEKGQVEEMYSEICCRYGPLKDGYNPKVKHISMSYDPISYIHRPLFFYAGVMITEAVSNVLFYKLRGYQRCEMEGVHYWFRPATADSSSELAPLLVFHGIAPGWMVYSQLVEQLAYGGRAVYLLDLSAAQIKSLSFEMHPVDDYARITKDILQQHGDTKASVVGHSIGSITASWFITAYPESVTHITLIDPVALLLHLPDVAHNFLYRQPSSVIEWIIYFFASQELTIAHMLSRLFWWYNNVLFLERVPHTIGVVVGISGNDEVLCPPVLAEYVDNCQKLRASSSVHVLSEKEESLKNSYVSSKNIDVKMDESLCQCESFIACYCGRRMRRPIVSLEWKGYSHGQMLVSGCAQRELRAAVQKNEFDVLCGECVAYQ